MHIFLFVITSESSIKRRMYRSLKNGQFAPHANISSGLELNLEEVKKKVMRFATDFSHQVYETDTVRIERQLTEEEMVAFVEIVVHELIYYHQLGEIGCFLATAFADDEKDAIDPDTPQSASSQEEADCGFLCRSASASDHPTEAPAIGEIATNLLVASGDIRKKITNLFMEMAMPNELFMLGPAGYSNFKDHVQQQYYHGRLVQTMMARLGGKVEIKCGLTLDQVLEHIVGIAKSSWALMNLCANSNAFRFTQSASPLFNTIQIDPMESVFGNWKLTKPCAPTHPQQWECDDVPSSAAPNTYDGHVLDYDSSGWDEFDEDQRRGGGYDHAEEAS